MTPTFQPRKPFRHRARAAEAAQPTPPPTPAVVIDAFRSEDGMVCTLVFDQPVSIAGPFDFGDGAIQCSDTNPIGVSVDGENGLALEFNTPITPGSAWNVNQQPAWLVTVVATPQDGSLP